jgi:hypothetical protein
VFVKIDREDSFLDPAALPKQFAEAVARVWREWLHLLPGGGCDALQARRTHTPGVNFMLEEGTLTVPIHRVHGRGELLADGSHDQLWLTVVPNH